MTLIADVHPAAPTESVLARTSEALLVGCIGWGVFAFGGVYPWAYWPLAGGALLAGGLGLAAGATAAWDRLAWVAVALASFAVAASLQTVPIGVELLARISPQTLQAVREYQLGLPASAHAISLAPLDTSVAVALFGSLAVLTVGSARLMSVTGARRIVQAIAAIGVLVALAGFAQRRVTPGLIYGFWTPEQAGAIYGPFVNRNHFAGWMVMAIPLTLGALRAAASRSLREMRPGWRNRLLWWSSPDASGLVLLAAAGAVMAMSVMLSLSRGGIGGLIAALAATTAIVVRRRHRPHLRMVIAAYIAIVVIAAVTWAGVDRLLTRFAAEGWCDFNDRRAAWTDASNVARMFPFGGTGLNTYGVSMLLYQRHDLAQHYQQAHNDYLQLAAEGGLLLVIPALACMVTFGAAVRQRFVAETGATSYWLRVGAVAGIGAIALQEIVDFSLQMPGNAVMFAALCAVALHRTPPGRSEARSAARGTRPWLNALPADRPGSGARRSRSSAVFSRPFCRAAATAVPSAGGSGGGTGCGTGGAAPIAGVRYRSRSARDLHGTRPVPPLLGPAARSGRQFKPGKAIMTSRRYVPPPASLPRVAGKFVWTRRPTTRKA